MTVKPIPDGYRSVTPFIIVDGAAKLMDFMKQAFGAEERFRFAMPDGSIAHAEVQIGDSIIMLTDGEAQYPAMPAATHLYLTDVDATYRRAMEAGGESLTEPKDQIYGDRSATVKDPAGNYWFLATHIEDVTPEEINRRAAALGHQDRS